MSHLEDGYIEKGYSVLVPSNMSNLSNLVYPNYLVPLVLHKIVKGQSKSWEDVTEEVFVNMIDKVGASWFTIDEEDYYKKKGCCLTFDDGNLSDFEIVYPILRERKIGATFFLITEKIGQKGYLTWSHIIEMKKNGMKFGSHSKSHRNMTSLTKKEAINEFVKSKSTLEDKIGDQITSFSYPYGENSRELNRLGFNSGYKFIYTSRHGCASKNATTIPRNSINANMSLLDIVTILNPSILTRSKWTFEDGAKSVAKKVLGRGRYAQIRNQTFRK